MNGLQILRRKDSMKNKILWYIFIIKRYFMRKEDKFLDKLGTIRWRRMMKKAERRLRNEDK